jgi:protein involved in polysaccharide export with SLBB domain
MLSRFEEASLSMLAPRQRQCFRCGSGKVAANTMKKSLTISIVFICWILFCPALKGQGNDRTSDRTNDRASDRSAVKPVYTQRPRTPDASELAKDNFNRVAASAVQIRAVLVRDTGLLVELKRWVAKEATDNGQIVEDSDLTDQAIFDRLDRDLAFRSVATRLVQRYGYLMPTPNPDSELGKQQDLILKERVKRFVALEAEQDNQLLHPEKKPEETERTTTCDPQRDETCEKEDSRNVNTDRQRQIEQQVPESNPSLPMLPPDLSPGPSQPRTLRSSLRSDDSDQGDRSPFSSLELTSGTGNSGSGTSGMFENGPFSPSITDLIASRGNSTLADRYDAEARNTNANIPNEYFRPKRSRPRRPRDEDVEPVKMVRSPNPYSDIPSLYDMYMQASATQRPAERFGLEVFRNTTNQPGVIPMDLPVGPDYVVGPGDSLAVDLWGGYSQRLVRLVDRTGRVSLPEVGPVLVSGKSLGEVQTTVQRALRSQFRDVSADVSVSRLRTIRIYVVGDVVEAGAYDISSLSTPLNALVMAGGVTSRGSLRTLKHYRGKQLIQEVDAYDLLLHGVRSDVQQMQSGDTILVPPLGPLVTVEGMVRRPAVYELRNETSLAEVLELAGGILPTAALRHIEVQRIEAHEKRTMLTLDLTSSTDNQAVDQQLQNFTIHGGDEVHIFPIASYNEDAIYLQGHVLRPGRYSYKKGMRLTDLISSYGDMLPEPAPHYAEIVRLNPPDFHPTVESFDLAAALATPPSSPTLQPLDTVRVFSRYDFQAPPDVWVGGEVRGPGKYRTSGQAHLRDAIYLAGGLAPDASLESAQLFRTQSDGTMKILSIDLREALAGNPANDILLQPRDRILVHRNPANVDPPTVYIKGEVAKPGRYPFAANMRVEDLVRVSGGLKRSADPELADLTRFAAANAPAGTNQRMEVKLAAALSGDASEDVPLRDGDVLTIRQVPQWNALGATVLVRGEVQHPAPYGIQPGEKLSSVLRRSGGFTDQAYPYGAVLLRPQVRELQTTSQLELVQRIKTEETYLKSLPEGDADQKNAKLTAIAQAETALQNLEATAPVGRVVVHMPSNIKDPDSLAKTSADVILQDGDELIIPKKTNYVMVGGQVYNPIAVNYAVGKSARWYLSQAGGITQIGDKNAAFVIRADGSVLSAKNNSNLWSGDPLNAVLKPGDSIVVPEKAPKIAPRNWPQILQAAQMASSVALTVAYIHP